MAIIEIKVPSPGESISQVELYRWLVKDGDVVKKGVEIAELESDKATLMLVADEAGEISLKASEGDVLAVGAVACTIDTSVKPEASSGEKPNPLHPEKKKETATDAYAKPGAPPRVEETSMPQVKPAAEGYDHVKITPLAKKVMEENGLSVEDVVNGLYRLKVADIEAVAREKKTSSVGGMKKNAGRETKVERLSSLRRKLSERLVSVKNETAMLTTFNEVNMKTIMDLRKKHQNKFVEKHGVKLGFMSFFVKACSVALQAFPNVNAMMDGENLISHDYTDISVAVSTPKGLMVPVIRNVEGMGLADIEKKIIELADKARAGKLSIPEMTGGTFTITNGGIFGSMLSTPIINPPQSAILGMHNILERPIAEDGQVVIRPMMYVALSYDHRIIDGKDSVGFLVRVKSLLENPVDMFFAGSNGERALLEL